jgi:hypothetical protein
VNNARPYNFDQPAAPRGFLRLFSLIWALATVILLGSGLYGLYENHLFATEGIHTQGKVDKQFDQTSITNKVGSQTRRYLSYSYTVDGTAYASAEIPVATSTWLQVDLHGAIPISYLRDDPAISRIDLPDENLVSKWFPLVLISLGVLFMVGGLAAVKTRGTIPHIT